MIFSFIFKAVHIVRIVLWITIPRIGRSVNSGPLRVLCIFMHMHLIANNIHFWCAAAKKTAPTACANCATV